MNKVINVVGCCIKVDGETHKLEVNNAVIGNGIAKLELKGSLNRLKFINGYDTSRGNGCIGYTMSELQSKQVSILIEGIYRNSLVTLILSKAQLNVLDVHLEKRVLEVYNFKIYEYDYIDDAFAGFNME